MALIQILNPVTGQIVTIDTQRPAPHKERDAHRRR